MLSLLGSSAVSPYTDDDDENTKRSTPASRANRSSLRVPVTFTS